MKQEQHVYERARQHHELVCASVHVLTARPTIKGCWRTSGMLHDEINLLDDMPRDLRAEAVRRIARNVALVSLLSFCLNILLVPHHHPSCAPLHVRLVCARVRARKACLPAAHFRLLSLRLRPLPQQMPTQEISFPNTPNASQAYSSEWKSTKSGTCSSG